MWSTASYPRPGGYRAAFQSPTAASAISSAPVSARELITGRRLPSSRRALVGPAEESERRAQKDPEVDERRAVVDVPDVERDPLGPRQRRASVHLRPSREPRLHLEPAPLVRGVALDLVRKRRPRPDEAHVAAQDVEQLRQLVDRQTAKYAADARYAGVALVHCPTRPARFGADDHRPELEELELAAATTDAPLAIQDRPAVLE